jgi:hypothetical protein
LRGSGAQSRPRPSLRGHDNCRARPSVRRFGGPALEAADLAVAQALVAQGADLAGHRHLGDLAPPPLGDSLEGGRQRPAAGGRHLGRLDERPAEDARALARDVTQPCPHVGASDGGGKPRPRRRACARSESVRRPPPRRSRAAPCSGRRRGSRSVPAPAHPLGPARRSLGSPAPPRGRGRRSATRGCRACAGERRAARERFEEAAARLAEQLAVGRQDPVAGAQRVHPTLERGAQPHGVAGSSRTPAVSK